MSQLTRRHLALAGLGLATAPRRAAAQAAYPTRPVTVVAPFAPGGSTDFVARLIAPALQSALGQPFTVDNRSGASGTVGAASVARARADGYTLLMAPNSTFAMAPFLFQIPYDNATAFAPISLLAVNPMAVCVAANSPIRDLAGLVAAARAAPGRVTYGHAGVGVSNHLAVELFAQAAGIQLEGVSYRGGAPAAQALLTGEVQLSFVDTVTAVPFLRERQMRALAVTGARRSGALPEVPTVAEQGFAGFAASTDFALFAPAGTPADILRRLGEAAVAAMRSAEVRDRLAPLAIDPVGGTPEEFAAYFAAETAKWREIIRAKNISVT